MPSEFRGNRRRSGASPRPSNPTVEAMLGARTADWACSDAEALRARVATLRPSARHLEEILDWIDDIAARDGCAPAVTLADTELQAALRAAGSGPDRLERWKARLRRMRYPRLVARESAIATAIAALELGAGILVTSPRGLEGGGVTITLRAASSGDLEVALDRLRRAVEESRFEQVFALLAEA
jgi:hypothetical protein